MRESWLPIRDCPGYEISNQGRVQRTDLFTPERVLVKHGHLVAQRPTGEKGKQYQAVNLRLPDGRRVSRRVHGVKAHDRGIKDYRTLLTP